MRWIKSPRYLQRLSGYSRAQIMRLVSRRDAGNPLVKNYGAPRCPFARLYTPADVALLADVDRAMGTLSGPATACVLRRQRPRAGPASSESTACTRETWKASRRKVRSLCRKS